MPRASKPRTSTSSRLSSDGNRAFRAPAHSMHWGPGPAGPFTSNRREIRGPDDFEIFHVGRIVEEVVEDTRPLVHAISCGNECLLGAVHEARPAFQHDDDVEFRLMAVPSGALFRCEIRPHELRKDLAAGRLGDAGSRY